MESGHVKSALNENHEKKTSTRRVFVELLVSNPVMVGEQ